MAKYGFLLAICIFTMSNLSKATDEERKVHIVYMGALPDDDNYSPASHHRTILQTMAASSFASNSLILSYERSFNGFAANLTDPERQKLASLKEVVSVFPSKTFHTHTTRSWDFIGLHDSVSRKPTVESDTIIGVIDSGIWPESESFSDQGLGPPPKKWKGACKGGKNFTCNNKIIGARFYSGNLEGGISARDDIGHGTHTASTAAGSSVKDVSFYGIAGGAARGGVPSARIAAYKVCDPWCSSHMILAAIDDAIADGVDIITMSLGHFRAEPFDEDVIAIGSFHAMKKGILLVNSAGNSGPHTGSVTSLAPWLLTVAASSMDRHIIDKLVLGNGATMIGNSVNSYTLNGTTFPLIFGKNASISNCTEERARRCTRGCLDNGLVKGKIVVCDFGDGTNEAYRVGALGLIVAKVNPADVSFVFPLPASSLNETDYTAVMSYLNSTGHPVANILKSEAIKDPSAPRVASFSSRGPNAIAPDIMKPDISAPGIGILAAFSPIGSPSSRFDDKRSVQYTILSGTSMSCPHVSGAAAYVKTFHPDWSPSAIKSSLMTTAWVMKNGKDVLKEFAYGSGHVNPVSAVNPGLVYEASEGDYIKFLCSIGYNDKRVGLISGDKSSCPSNKGSPRDLNYPSMTALVTQDTAFTVQFQRRVKNVGFSNSTYEAKTSQQSGLDIQVVPSVLSFNSLNEEKSFNVTVKGKLRGLGSNFTMSASLVWTDGTHQVRSPIVMHNINVYRNQNLG